jgi:hypothetical protein
MGMRFIFYYRGHRYSSEGPILRRACIREDNVQLSMFALDLFIEPIEIRDARYIGLTNL